MWQGNYQTTCDVLAEDLYRVICDIANWPAWDEGLIYTQVKGVPVAGMGFVLKPKGGPDVKMRIDEMQPYRLVDTAFLLGAQMRTIHEYIPCGSQTLIRMRVEVRGLMSFFWRKIVAEDQIKQAPQQIQAFIRYAQAQSA